MSHVSGANSSAAAQVASASAHNYPMNQWYVAAGRSELGRELLRRQLLGKWIVLYRTEAGAPVALLDWCPHRGFQLSRSTLAGDEIVCGYHGMRFAPDGRCTKVPTQDFVPPQLRARSYPVVEKWHWVWIWLGDPDNADPALIPHTGFEDREGYFHNFFFCYPIQGNYMLLHDNLLDATHVSFLHGGLVDNPDAAEIATTKFKMEVSGTMIRTVRDIKHFVPLGPNATILGLQEGVPVRRQLVTETHLPSLVVINTRTFDLSTDELLTEQIAALPVVPGNPRLCYHFAAFSNSFPWGGEP
ncbi:MAG: aromatic ring-hydroxylating dioxygenase subunit alpha, partial [Steroidobacteraceae bacterium]